METYEEAVLLRLRGPTEIAEHVGRSNAMVNLHLTLKVGEADDKTVRSAYPEHDIESAGSPVAEREKRKKAARIRRQLNKLIEQRKKEKDEEERDLIAIGRDPYEVSEELEKK
jgi:hypothetical protein